MLPALVFSQEDIERYKIYPTENIYTSLKLDTPTGRIWQLQIGLGDDVDRVASVLSDQWLVDNKDGGKRKAMVEQTPLPNLFASYC